MTPERWQQVTRILSEAERLAAADLPTFLERACGGDGALQREVESLLEFVDAEETLVEKPLFYLCPPEEAGAQRRIGPYKVLREIGRGGMGTVFLAVREGDFEQRVALKLIRLEDSEELLRRFRNERRILAALEHPNIARLLDGGSTEEGVPYFAMEYVEGDPIDRYCDAERLSTRRRLELVLQVCAAVQASHRNLVVHRDLKPGNILVTAEGTAKLLDFGIAKLLEEDAATRLLLTDPQQRPMTPLYASPEQVRGEPITTASDIYSLGVLLFGLLTGHPPYRLDTGGYPEIVRKICDEEPKKPSTAVRHPGVGFSRGGTSFILTPEAVSRTRDGDPRKLRRRLAGDLDAIVLKALRKEPGQRYGSVEQLAGDIRRHLEGSPVRARTGTFTYRAGKLVRRHKVAAAVLLLILGFGVSSTVLWRRAEGQRVLAEQAQSRAEQAQELAVLTTEFLKGLFQANNPDEARGEELSAREVLQRGRETIDQLKEDAPTQAELLRTLGDVYRNLGDYGTARELLVESLRILRSHYPGDHRELAKAINNRAGMLFRMEKYEDAERLFREALAMERRLGRSGLGMLDNRAAMLVASRKFAEAEAVYRQALETRTERYGPESWNVAKSLYDLGAMFFMRGDLDQAESFLHQALELNLQHLDPEHTRVSRVADTLGRVLLARGDLVQARRELERALAIRSARLDPDHVDIAYVQRDLAELCLAEGDAEQAGRLIRQALGPLRRELPADTWKLADAESVLGAVLVAEGRYEDAEPYLVESYRVLQAERGPEAVETRGALERVVELYESWGRPEKLAEVRALSD